ncbi:MAG: FtsX-like permease family protein [Limnothrix sp. RL_2_0]|nr:FtsX-like permease family protein [Limnothrix sp. RL_2_0]
MQVLLFKASLSWRNLIHHRQRFVAAIFAVGFAVMLMFTQIGFRNGMLASNVAFLQLLNADLIMINSQRNITTLERTFKKTRLYQAQSLLEITGADAFYLTLATWKNEITSKERVIRVFAFNPEKNLFLLPEIEPSLNALKRADTVLTDLKSKAAYGAMEEGVSTELSGYRIKVVGNFTLGTDFIADGNLIMGDRTFFDIFSQRPSGFAGNFRKSLEDVDLGLLTVKKGTNFQQLITHLEQILPNDVHILTKQDYVAREIKFYSTATLGFIFTLGAIIGFVIGTVIVYNIITTDIKQNMVQYGTLRAIGHSSQYLLSVILLQSLFIAILGFIPGLLISILLCASLSQLTGLLIPLELHVGISIFLSTILMCLFAAIIAARRLDKIDPADIYAQKF